MNILVCQPPPSPPVQKADNCYQLDDSAMGLSNGALPACEQTGHGADSRKCPNLNGPEIKYSNQKLKKKSSDPSEQTLPFGFVN